MNRRYAIALAALFTVACDGERPAARVASDGDTARGREAVIRYGCGACHEIPGVPGAQTTAR